FASRAKLPIKPNEKPGSGWTRTGISLVLDHKRSGWRRFDGCHRWHCWRRWRWRRQNRLLIQVELTHEGLAGSRILELPQMILHAFEDQRIDRKLDAFAHRQRRRRVGGPTGIDLEERVDRSELDGCAADID